MNKIFWTNSSIKYSKKEKDIILKSLDSEPQTQGRYLKKFENNFSKYLGVKKSYAVANCSNALDLCAMLINTKKGDEIIVPAHTWCASAISFARFGAKIVWSDIDSNTFLSPLKYIKKLVTKNTKAIVVVHLYGLPAEIDDIVKFAKKRNIIVIEDCAQALGAKVKNKIVGTFGDLSVFSFHSNKCITTLGEGGMLVVNNKKFDRNIEALRHNGVNPFVRKNPEIYWKPAMNNIVNASKNFWPYNFSIGETQCALGSELILRVDELNKIRINRAEKFRSFFRNYEELTFQFLPKNYKNVYHCLVARYNGVRFKKNRDDLIKILFKKYRIQTIVQNCPLYRYSLFKKFSKNVKCKETDVFFDNMISWPFYTYMSEKKFEYMMRSTKLALEELRK